MKYTCPSCGYKVFNEPPGSYDICPICYWEDDLSQLRFPSTRGANISLIEAQKNYQEYGAIEKKFIKHVRAPGGNDEKDTQWYAIDTVNDNIEYPKPGVDYGSTYPDDRTKLYYWTEKFWRKRSKTLDID